MSDRGLAPVIDINQARERRAKARRKIVQMANRVRLERSRYVRMRVWHREVASPKLLGLRNLHEAVAIVRHWGAIDDETLIAAGFRPRRVAPTRLKVVEDEAA